MIWFAIDILFIVLFLHCLAHEKGWWSARILSWYLNAEDFGKNRINYLIMNFTFIGIWVWILIDHIKALIQ